MRLFEALFAVVIAPDADTFVGRAGQHILHIPLEQTDARIVDFVILISRVCPAHVNGHHRHHGFRISNRFGRHRSFGLRQSRHGHKAQHHTQRRQEHSQQLFHTVLPFCIVECAASFPLPVPSPPVNRPIPFFDSKQTPNPPRADFSLCAFRATDAAFRSL